MVDHFSEGGWCAGKQAESHKNFSQKLSTLSEMAANQPSVSGSLKLSSFGLGLSWKAEGQSSHTKISTPAKAFTENSE